MNSVRVFRNVVFTQRSFATTAVNLNQAPKDAPHEPPVLPDLPAPVKGWPSFWVIRKEVEEYLYPLYARGWGVDFLPRKNHPSRHDLYIAHLTTDYSFANFNCATQFIVDLATTANEEKHHPSRLTLKNDKRPVLSLQVLTHSALRPRWNEEDASPDPPLSRRVPGITRRDLRFAVFTEQLYEKYHKDGRALESRGTKLKHVYDRPTWPYLVSRFVRSSLGMERGTTPQEEQEHLLQLLANSGETTGTTNYEAGATALSNQEDVEAQDTKCHACGGPHRIQNCPVRSQYPPPTLCYICLKPHWWLDCPERQNP